MRLVARGERKRPQTLEGTEVWFSMGTMTKSADRQEVRRLEKEG